MNKDNIKKIKNQFDLVLFAANLARKIQIQERKSLIFNKKEKPTVVALREIEKKLKKIKNTFK